VLLVGDGRHDPGSLAQADVAVTVVAGSTVGLRPASAAPIEIAEIDDLAILVDLGRAVRAVIVESAAFGAVYNAAIIPAAALGYVSPIGAAGLALAETLLGLANAARLLYWPRLS
jgi:cation transport ATPase